MVPSKCSEVTKHPSWTAFCFILLGIWLFLSIFSFPMSSTLFWSDAVSGTLLILLGLINRKKPKSSILWCLALIGIWLQAAPLIFWAPNAGTYINETLIGSLVIAFAVILFPMPGQVPDIEPTVPPGWNYNPSSFAQRLPIAFFGFICWMISRYLCAYQMGYIDTAWDPFFNLGTQEVLDSDVSKAFPVSDAGLGALAYTLEFFSVCQGGKARWRTSPWGVLVFGILVIPLGIVSTILIILQPLVVGSWCWLCLLSAICMIFPIPFAVDEVLATLRYLKRSKGTLFKGGTCKHATEDKKTPPMESSLLRLIKASSWGVTFPWSLCALVGVGIYLMTLEVSGLMANIDPLIGPLLIVVSVIAFAEQIRFVRKLNYLLAAILALTTFVSGESLLLHLTLAVAIVLLSIPRGTYANHPL